MIEFKNVSFSYGSKAVINDLSFTVNEGECFVIAGENGAGKSTALALAAGILRPDSGTVTVTGSIGYAPQQPTLFEDLTVLDNLRFFARLRGVSVPDEFFLPISGFLKKPVGKLSGGMKKRVSLVCAGIGSPDVMLLDEPASALDAQSQSLLRDRVLSWKSEGKCILYVGHDLKELEAVGDRLVFTMKATLP